MSVSLAVLSRRWMIRKTKAFTGQYWPFMVLRCTIAPRTLFFWLLNRNVSPVASISSSYDASLDKVVFSFLSAIFPKLN